LPKTFEHLPRRWVVERTIAWIGRSHEMRNEVLAASELG